MHLIFVFHYYALLLKAYPQEKVGVFVQRGRGGPLSVVEYSEMDAAMTTEINQGTGRLRYCWSNVCLFLFPFPSTVHPL
jgi:UDP-N-acetylglucosamine/UDP-N-acetylgalactosamine diphosphorylase